MSDGLQFDKVEPGSPGQGLVCAACKSPLTGEYFAARDVTSIVPASHYPRRW